MAICNPDCGRYRMTEGTFTAIARGEQVIEGVNAQLVGVTQVMNDLENKE